MTTTRRQAGLLGGLLTLVSAIPGVASATVEEPAFELVHSDGDFEVRDYAPTIQARTVVHGDYRQGLYGGFRVLARYIFGGNATGQEVAMTAPVGHVPHGAGTWEVVFTMPSEHTLATLPPPVDDRVSLVPVPGGPMAAVRFAGRAGESAMAAQRDRLLAWVANAGLQPAGEPVYAQYNPPWVPGVFRRNEVLVPLESARGS